MSARVFLSILCGVLLLAGTALVAGSPEANAQGCPRGYCPR
jgi:hypothetical protein